MTEKFLNSERLALSHWTNLLFLSLFWVFYWTFAGFELNFFECRPILMFDGGNWLPLNRFGCLTYFVDKMRIILFLNRLLSGNLWSWRYTFFQWTNRFLPFLQRSSIDSLSLLRFSLWNGFFCDLFLYSFHDNTVCFWWQLVVFDHFLYDFWYIITFFDDQNWIIFVKAKIDAHGCKDRLHNDIFIKIIMM